MAIKGHSYMLNKLYNEVEVDFRAYLDNSNDSRCLLNILKIPGTDILTSVVEYVLRFYNTKHNNFKINGNILCITLEDVLYLTGLPIQGDPVISNKNRDLDGFQRVFQLPATPKTPLITSILNIARDVNRDYDTRKRAVLLLIVRLFIAPICGGHRVSPTFIQFIENLSKVDSYAWGAALLAFLYNGIKEYKGKKNNKVLHGNSWIILAFFLLRIPSLQKALGLDLSEGELDVPVMGRIVEQVMRVSHNHRVDYEQILEDVFSNLMHDDVTWTPYTRVRNEHRMDQDRNGTYMGAIICNNYVGYHKPYLAHHQFQVLQNCDPEAIVWNFEEKEVKKNSGGNEQKLFTYYRKEIDSWTAMVLAQSYLQADNDDLPTESERERKRKRVEVVDDSNRVTKKTLVLDVNGLLVDIVPVPVQVPRPTHRWSSNPFKIINGKAVYKRPKVDEFLKFCFEKFNVGVWSSRNKENLDPVLDYVFGNYKKNLAFQWNQKDCTKTGENVPGHKNKPVFLKKIEKLWEDPEIRENIGVLNESNTLLIDDSHYKVEKNPPNTSISPHTYKYCNYLNDNSLGVGGDIREYLEKLSSAPNVQKFVEQNMF